ncbi:MAG: hypothetical protein KKD76_04165, partial [Verrucomicrobia bacterium]|nr:hypothetical protein [Verrucomicrobiota bacterium]
FHMRISKGVKDPLTVTALAMSTGDDSVIFVSCDAPYVPSVIYDRCRAAVRAKAPEIDLNKIILNGTHTHTAPQIINNIFYPPVPDGVMTPEEYAELFVERVAEAVAEAWKNRETGGTSFGLGTAVVGHNRRATYFDDIGARTNAQTTGKFTDGYTKMYGNTNDPKFSHIEGYEDHYVDLMFTWNKSRQMTGIIVNLACPSQETEGDVYVSADFWHEIRTEIRKRHGEKVQVLAQCSSAGDQSPHRMWYKKAEQRMLALRGLDMRQEIGRRVANAVDDVLPLAGKAIQTTLSLKHIVKDINLPRRLITDAEADAVRNDLAKLEAEESAALTKNQMHSSIGRCKNALERYKLQIKYPKDRMELHVLRLGEAAFATNRFELFLDYGVRIKARSPAAQTFLVQLAGSGSYLPTERAVAGKGYGGGVYDNEVGPEGGQVLVEETLRTIDELWKGK